MTWTARYIHRRGEAPEYFRTVHGNSINEAIREAERYTRKGFLMVGLTQRQGAVA
jgi:hypothetical protein